MPRRAALGGLCRLGGRGRGLWVGLWRLHRFGGLMDLVVLARCGSRYWRGLLCGVDYGSIRCESVTLSDCFV